MNSIQQHIKLWSRVRNGRGGGLLPMPGTGRSVAARLPSVVKRTLRGASPLILEAEGCRL